MAKSLIEGARRGNVFYVAPEDIVVIGLDTDDGPEHYLYDERVKLPVDPAMVANIRALGVIEPVIVEVIKGVAYKVDGGRRVKHARVANVELAKEGEPVLLVPVIAVKGDEERLGTISISMNEIRRQDDITTKSAKAARMLARNVAIGDVAIAFGVSTPTIRAWLAIDQLAAPVKKAIEAGVISATAAAKWADLPKSDQVAALALASEASKGKRIPVKAAERTVNPDAVKRPSKAAMMEAIAKVPGPFADGVRFALGILDVLPVELLEAAE